MAIDGWIKRLADALRNEQFDAGDLEDAADLIERLVEERDSWKLRKETVEVSKATPEWISVKDRLPEEYKGANNELINYLCYMPEYGVDIANYLKPAGKWVCMGIPVKVTHWRPLPEPPKEEVTHEQD